MLIESSFATHVREELEGHGFEQTLALGAVPVGNALGVRYPLRVTARGDGSEWYLRAHGADFTLLSPEAKRFSGRWFSLGWGMLGGIQVPELLLVQVNRCAAAEAAMLKKQIERELVSVCTAIDASIAQISGHTCLRVSAVLGTEASRA